MEKKQKFALIFLVLILLALPVALYLAKQRQEIRKKAAEACTITFDPSFLPANSWRQVGSKYQILTSQNKFQLTWQCTNFNVKSFSVQSAIIDTSGSRLSNISNKCKADNTPCGTNNCTLPQAKTTGTIYCEGLTNTPVTLNISVNFTRE